MIARTAHLALALLLTTALPACESKKSTPAGASSAKPGGAAATLKPQGTPIKAGQPFTVAWTGPGGADDYIDVVASGRPMQVGDEVTYVKTSAGNPAKLTLPDPGSYDVRYVQDSGGRNVIAHTAITVTK